MSGHQNWNESLSSNLFIQETMQIDVIERYLVIYEICEYLSVHEVT